MCRSTSCAHCDSNESSDVQHTLLCKPVVRPALCSTCSCWVCGCPSGPCVYATSDLKWHLNSQDGQQAHVDSIVYCTGYHYSYPWLPDGVLEIGRSRCDLASDQQMCYFCANNQHQDAIPTIVGHDKRQCCNGFALIVAHVNRWRPCLPTVQSHLSPQICTQPGVPWLMCSLHFVPSG